MIRASTLWAIFTYKWVASELSNNGLHLAKITIMIFQKLPFRYDEPVAKGANYVKVAIIKVLDEAHGRMFPDSGQLVCYIAEPCEWLAHCGELRKKRQERRAVSLRTPPSERLYPQDWKGLQVSQTPANVMTSPIHASPNFCVSLAMGELSLSAQRDPFQFRLREALASGTLLKHYVTKPKEAVTQALGNPAFFLWNTFNWFLLINQFGGC